MLWFCAWGRLVKKECLGAGDISMGKFGLTCSRFAIILWNDLDRVAVHLPRCNRIEARMRFIDERC
jgi:hypothetical protein